MIDLQIMKIAISLVNSANGRMKISVMEYSNKMHLEKSMAWGGHLTGLSTG